MQKNNLDPLEELFENQLKDYEQEVQTDILGNVQARLRFDNYLKVLLKTVSISSVVAIPVVIYSLFQIEDPDNVPMEEKIRSEIVNIDKVDKKKINVPTMALETVDLQIKPVIIVTSKKMDDSVDDLEITEEPNGDNEVSIASTDEKVTSTEHLPERVEYGYFKATPVDGYEHLYQHIGQTLTYPDSLRKDAISGTVLVHFSINTEGKVEKVHVQSGIHELLDKEAIRVIEHMPLWFPARLNGKPVVSEMTIPIRFNIEDFELD